MPHAPCALAGRPPSGGCTTDSGVCRSIATPRSRLSRHARGVVQRPAAERRESGAEDRARRRPGRRRRRCPRPAPPSPRRRTGRSAGRRAPPARRRAPASPACRSRSRRSRAWSCARGARPRPARPASSAASASGASILPTATQMSRPTVSASSIGPIGMPNASAASSTVSGAMPSSTQRIAAIRYGASTRLTRKPGALFTGSGSLSIWRTNAAAGARRARRASAGRRRSRPASSSPPD